MLLLVLGSAADLVEDLVDMVRQLVARDGTRRGVTEIPLPGPMGAAMSSGRLRGSPETSRQGRQTYADWLGHVDTTG